jgi:hypothetical protein
MWRNEGKGQPQDLGSKTEPGAPSVYVQTPEREKLYAGHPPTLRVSSGLSERSLLGPAALKILFVSKPRYD